MRNSTVVRGLYLARVQLIDRKGVLGAWKVRAELERDADKQIISNVNEFKMFLHH